MSKIINTVSRLYQPIKVIPKYSDTAKSYRLMVDTGIIKQCNPGMYSLLPIGYRVLEKLTSLIDTEMKNIGAQKMLLPSLTASKLWDKTGRLAEMGMELLTLKDRHNRRFLLSPTYEEAITDLINSIGPLSKRQLPLLLYQISSKWRDEMKPRLGLFRGREFVMKDLYSFDATPDDAKQTYETVAESYNKIFTRIGIPFSIAEGDTGVMGGSLSHEYHYLSEMGEDQVLSCDSCGFNINSTLSKDSKCKNCKKELEKHSAIEVGHTFLLGTKYSEIFKAVYTDQNTELPLIMGCYGIGLTRLMAAIVQVLSTNDEIRWPEVIAPFTVCIIPPKENSRESFAFHYLDKIVDILSQRNIDFIVDDRLNQTIGKRIKENKRTGYPYVIVIGKLSVQDNPLFELHNVNNSEEMSLSLTQLQDFFEKSNFKSQLINREAAM